MFNRKAIRINDEVKLITIMDIIKKLFGMNKRMSPEELFSDTDIIQKPKDTNL